MPEHMTDAHFSFTFVFKQALIYKSVKPMLFPTSGNKLLYDSCQFVSNTSDI